MILKRLLAASCLVGLTGAAYAGEEWVPISEDTDGFIYFIDANNLKPEAQGIRFWVRSLYQYNPEYPQEARETIDGKLIRHTVSSFVANCGDNRLIGPTHWAAFGEDNDVLRAFVDEQPEDLQPEVDTVADSWMDAVCAVYDDANLYNLERKDMHFI